MFPASTSEMNRMIVWLLIPFQIISYSCNNNEKQCLFISFDHNTWNRFEKQKFEFSVENTSFPYDVMLTIRHNEDYLFDNLYINVVMEMPGGEERIMEYDFKIKDANGNFQSNVKSGYHELSFPLHEELHFSGRGVCRVEIENLIPKMEIPGILELGLCLLQSEDNQHKKTNQGLLRRF